MGSVLVPMGANDVSKSGYQNPALGRMVVAPRKLLNPMIQPKQIQLQASLATGAGILQIFLEDAIQLGVILGLCGGANTQTLVVPVVTAAVLRQYLKSYALVITGYDFNCTNADETSKNLQFAESSIDQNSATDTSFSADSKNNYQNTPNLLNIANSFIMLPTTNLRMNVTANTTGVAVVYTLTLFIEKAVPIADVDSYLASRPAN